MHILGIDAFASRKEISGVERYTRELLRAMRKLTPPGWSVFLYSLDEEEVGAPGADGDGWKHCRLGWPPRRGWSQVRLSWEMWRRAPDVLFVPHAAIPWKSPGGRTVTTVHDIGALEVPGLYAGADLARQKLALRLAVSRANRIFVPSEAVKRALASHFSGRIFADRVIAAHLGVDGARFNPRESFTDKAVRAKYGINFPYFLYAGRIDAKKNLLTMMRAYKKFLAGKYSRDSAPSLVIVGALGFGAREVLDFAESEGMKKRVRFLGWVRDEDLPALYRGAEIFLFPSLHEGFGLPVLEAMASGVPVLASDIPALREVGGNAALYANPKSEDDWVESMHGIFNNWALRSGLSAKGPVRAADFSWERCADTTWKTILSLVK